MFSTSVIYSNTLKTCPQKILFGIYLCLLTYLLTLFVTLFIKHTYCKVRNISFSNSHVSTFQQCSLYVLDSLLSIICSMFQVKLNCVLIICASWIFDFHSFTFGTWANLWQTTSWKKAFATIYCLRNLFVIFSSRIILWCSVLLRL